MRFNRFRNFWNETYITATPVLSPMSAGRAMMVNPKIVVMHLLMLAIGDSHDPECGCEVCNYRRFNPAKATDGATRFVSPVVATKGVTNLGCLIEVPYELTSSDAWYWTQWMADHFEGLFTDWNDLASMAGAIEEMSEPQAGDYLLDRVIAASNKDYGFQEIVDDFLETGVHSLEDPQDGFEALHYLAAQAARM